MTTRSILMISCIVALTVALWAAPVAAGDEGQTSESSLPEAVSELVDALSGVERVEPVEENRFAVHRRIDVTGSRVKRDVTMIIDEEGNVVDWGRAADFVRSYTLSELRSTGQGDMASALADLDPSIQTRGGG